MGWTGHGNYDGDGTQTQHLTFLEWAKIPVEQDTMSDWMSRRKTKIPAIYLKIFKKNLPKVLVRMNSNKFWNEDKAIQWQMLACLLIDNNIKLPKIIAKNAALAIEYLLGEHSSEFDKPSQRRAALRRLLKKISIRK